MEKNKCKVWMNGRGDSDVMSEEEEEECIASWGIKRTIGLVDPEYSGSVVVQDRESETESNPNPTRRRSNRRTRTRREPLTSISTEEDVAFWLIMLSRDNKSNNNNNNNNKKQNYQHLPIYDSDDDDDENDDSRLVKLSKIRNRGRSYYECETCNKVFGSYQALGGHRASHKKMKLVDQGITTTPSRMGIGGQNRKIHECPVCFRVFSSGQALGGHKRSHIAGFATPVPNSNNNVIKKKFGEGNNVIDLNLPAPFEDDDLSSQLSDSHFAISQY